MIEPHDVILNPKDGMVWYTNFGEQNIGKLDPKTGKVTEVTLPELKKGWPQGSLGLRPDGNEQGHGAGQHGAAGIGER